MHEYRFDADTAVAAVGDGRFEGELAHRWTIAGIPNGGYVMGMMLRACQAMSNHPDPLTATGHFLSPTAPGPVEVRVETVKAGRSSSTFQASLHQEDRERIRLLATFGHLDGRDGPDHLFLDPPSIEPPFTSERSPLVQEFPENFVLEIPQSVAGGTLGKPTGEPEIGGRMAFADGRPADLVSLPVFADGLAPVAFNLGYPAWTPTLELTIHFWNHPAPGPLSVWITTDVVVGGYHDETANLWDSEGRLVGRSRQLARILT
jgi:hypothetical protein